MKSKKTPSTQVLKVLFSHYGMKACNHGAASCSMPGYVDYTLQLLPLNLEYRIIFVGICQVPAMQPPLHGIIPLQNAIFEKILSEFLEIYF
ncbi:MAG: hypothetical protein J6C84_09195 [Lachnospiraceae bacterium]|nr:hypothetical protein [Lachnospiraceae bacterium]